MFSDFDIVKNLGKHIEIDPYVEELLQPCSYDVTLSNKFGIFEISDEVLIDVTKDRPKMRHVITEEILVKPGQMILASTIERVWLSNFVAARLEGKSSLARLGLLVHTAGFIDAGFRGQITLEISNLLGVPLKLKAGMPIAQLCFFKLDSSTENPYSGHYQDQEGVLESQYAAAFEEFNA